PAAVHARRGNRGCPKLRAEFLQFCSSAVLQNFFSVKADRWPTRSKNRQLSRPRRRNPNRGGQAGRQSAGRTSGCGTPLEATPPAGGELFTASRSTGGGDKRPAGLWSCANGRRQKLNFDGRAARWLAG